MSEKRKNYLLIAIGVLIGILGIVIPRRILDLYDWQITVFILAPYCSFMARAIVIAGRGERKV